MKVSIGMLSDTYSLTPEALRYYEEKGLLTPERGKGGRNRRFSLDDVQRMGIIKSLQRQGFSLNEIRRVMTGCPLDELIAMVDDKRAELSRQLRISSAIHERMTAGAYLLRDAERLQMQPRLSAGCAAYFVDFASPADLWAHVGDCPVLKDLIGAFPLTTYSTIVPFARLRGEDVPCARALPRPRNTPPCRPISRRCAWPPGHDPSACSLSSACPSRAACRPSSIARAASSPKTA